MARFEGDTLSTEQNKSLKKEITSKEKKRTLKASSKTPPRSGSLSVKKRQLEGQLRITYILIHIEKYLWCGQVLPKKNSIANPNA